MAECEVVPKDTGLQRSFLDPLWPRLRLLSDTCRVPRTPQKSGENQRQGWRWLLPSDPPGSQPIKALLCLKGSYTAFWDFRENTRGWGLLSSFFLSSHQPIHKSPEKEVQHAQPVVLPCPPQTNPRFSQGPSPCSHSLPTPYSPGTPPLRTGRSLVAQCPLTLPFLTSEMLGTPISG